MLIDFIDKTSEQSGTPINRDNLMAMQGFISSDTVFNDDGSITETNSKGETLTTTFNDDGSITEIFVGEKTITKTTTFNSDRSISEVIS
jgi:exosome complex RNA-binding protein Rrp42 (RNase PH superfamily)